MVPICDSDPIGTPLPRRTVSTPAMNVVDTAPSPTSITPSFPLAGAMSRPASTATLTVLSEIVARAGGAPHRGFPRRACDVEHALHHRHRGGERQHDDDPEQQHSVVPGAEK